MHRFLNPSWSLLLLLLFISCCSSRAQNLPDAQPAAEAPSPQDGTTGSSSIGQTSSVPIDITGPNTGSACDLGYPGVCPNPSTVQSLDLQAYSGLWYEIGSTALFKLSVNSICTTARYTLNAPPPAPAPAPAPAPGPPSQGQPTVRVENSGIQAFPQNAVVAVQQLSNSSVGLCSGLSRLCDALGGQNSSLPGIIANVTGAVFALSSSVRSSDRAAAGQAAEALQGLLTGQRDLTAGVGSIRALLTRVERAVADISGGGDNLQVPPVAALAALGARLSYMQARVGLLDASAAQLSAALGSLQGGGPAPAPAPLPAGPGPSPPPTPPPQAALAPARDAAVGLAQDLASRLADVRTQLAGVAASLATLSRVGGGDDSQMPQNVSAVGQAVVDPAFNQTSKLLVSFGPGAPGPYWVVSLLGDASTGYEAALVFSCQNETAPGPQMTPPGISTYWILSRTPTLATSSLFELLSLAKTYNLGNECGNPFLLTPQDPLVCNASSVTNATAPAPQPSNAPTSPPGPQGT